MEELPTNKDKRVEYIQKAYVADEIGERQLEKFLESAISGGPPFFVDWFKMQPETRHKRYTENSIYLYKGDEYIVEDDAAVPLEKEIERTIDVTR